MNYIKCKAGIENCNDAQEISKDVLCNEFGSYGLKLYDLVRVMMIDWFKQQG